jgi:hypothetical protein
LMQRRRRAVKPRARCRHHPLLVQPDGNGGGPREELRECAAVLLPLKATRWMEVAEGGGDDDDDDDSDEEFVARRRQEVTKLWDGALSGRTTRCWICNKGGGKKLLSHLRSQQHQRAEDAYVRGVQQ